jgi:trafficking protein particle complex subunit 12
MASHARKLATRAALPRRSTRGPLDAEDDPLSPTSSLASSAIRSPVDTRSHSPLPPAATTTNPEVTPSIATITQLDGANDSDQPQDDLDLSFLFEPSIYHPLSQLDIPGPFRKPLPPPLPATVNLFEAFKQIDRLLAECDYLQAAHLAGLVLVSGAVLPTDQRSIFRLLAIRYSCLELSSNVSLAAQESKALEDLGSNFYYFDPAPETADGDENAETSGLRPLPKHIVPWHLRIQALRLQSIGFSDPRRGVSALYDLATECRDFLASPSLSGAERQLWTTRLEELGVRVVNALIDMGDLDCARRTLDSMRPPEDGSVAVWTMRKAILCIRMGLLGEARMAVESASCGDAERQILRSLLAVADGHFDNAIELLQSPTCATGELAALAKQNLAVALLYRSDIQKAREILEGLVDEGHSFQTLTVNLATIYDLTTDRSRELKLTLADRIAQQQHQGQGHARIFTNTDFKL